jgi:hypothetical protein
VVAGITLVSRGRIRRVEKRTARLLVLLGHKRTF